MPRTPRVRFGKVLPALGLAPRPDTARAPALYGPGRQPFQTMHPAHDGGTCTQRTPAAACPLRYAARDTRTDTLNAHTETRMLPEHRMRPCGTPSCVLPEPSEETGGQQAVYQPVQRMAHRIPPGHMEPDAAGKQRGAVGQGGCGSRDLKYLEVCGRIDRE